KDLVKTSVEGVFAAGDVCNKRYRQAVVASALGSIAAIEAEKFLEGGKG
ncbi:MAG: thioredoxin-disulfide reductase, partial [Candidatus Bathyarchaeia archaeon]